jgi:hypothetical protein
VSDDILQWIDELRAFKDAPARVAPAVAAEVRSYLVSTAGSGRDAAGKAWAPKKDGSAPLKNAVNEVSVRAIGPVVVCRLTGPSVFHDLGIARHSKERRGVLPDAAIPEALAERLRPVILGGMTNGNT